MDLSSRTRRIISDLRPTPQPGIAISGRLPLTPPVALSAAGGAPQVFLFQTLVTIKGAAAAGCVAIQPFSGWFDGQNVTEVHFKVEILKLTTGGQLVLESSPFVEEDPAQWVALKTWTSRPGGGFEIVTAVSSSGEQAYGYPFSRYIRWRAAYASGQSPWVVCFRITALTGASFTQWAETPRLV